MTTQHTSGPWRSVVASAHEFNPNTRRRDIIGKCEFGDAYVAGDISEIDARLIAAAPDLLSALKQIADWEPSAAPSEPKGFSIIEVIDIARAAIAKAEGRVE